MIEAGETSNTVGNTCFVTTFSALNDTFFALTLGQALEYRNQPQGRYGTYYICSRYLCRIHDDSTTEIT